MLLTLEAYPSPRALCSDWGLKPHKGLGQNFLENPRTLRAIASFFPVSSGSAALEIGPGLGHLTLALLESGYVSVSAIEVDTDLQAPLAALTEACPQIKIHFADARSLRWDELPDNGSQRALFGNLPYYISTELFTKALLDCADFDHMVFLLQKEAAVRLTAPEAQRQYGPSSILYHLYGSIAKKMTVPLSDFYPRPGVSSLALFLQGDGILGDWERKRRYAFYDFLRLAFRMRRKTLENNLKGTVWDLGRQDFLELEKMMKLYGGRRPEMLSSQDFSELFQIGEMCYES